MGPFEIEIRSKASECVVAVYGNNLPENVKNGLVNMFLAGFMEGFNLSISLGTDENQTEEEIVAKLEVINSTLEEIRDGWLKGEMINKEREEGLSYGK